MLIKILLPHTYLTDYVRDISEQENTEFTVRTTFRRWEFRSRRVGVFDVCRHSAAVSPPNQIYNISADQSIKNYELVLQFKYFMKHHKMSEVY